MNAHDTPSALLALLEPPARDRRPAQAEAPPAWLQAVADAVTRAGLHELVATGFLPGENDAIGDRRVLAAAGSGAPDGLWLLHLSPLRTHRALAWLPASAGPWCTQVWMDARSWRFPPDADGPGALLPGHWADDDTWAVPFAPHSHPLQDWRRNVGLGVQRGLWVLDAADGCDRVLLPPADRHWPAPQLVPGARWLVRPEPGAAPVRPA